METVMSPAVVETLDLVAPLLSGYWFSDPAKITIYCLRYIKIQYLSKFDLKSILERFDIKCISSLILGEGVHFLIFLIKSLFVHT